MKTTARVFPTQTNMTPTDADAYYGPPDLFTPRYDQVLISATFSWDRPRAQELARAWAGHGAVQIGGPAYGDRGGQFKSGLFLRRGITITSRGCPGRCPFCFVPEREGPIRELKIQEGNVIQDNNLLACSPGHLARVFKMLQGQRQVKFAGGLDAARITDKTIDALRSLRIDEIWVASDTEAKEKTAAKAIKKLRKYFSKDKVRCYVLIGTADDTLAAAEARLERVFEAGALPFPQRYRTAAENKHESFLLRDRPWNLLARKWSRPASAKAYMRDKK